jgi:uncharacterized protein
VALGAAAFAAGAINSLAGGGSLLTFPLLVALGLPPLTANVTNTLGHTPGYASIVAGLREALAGQRQRVLAAIPLTVLGAAGGAVLLTVCSRSTFADVAPVLVAASAALLALGARRDRVAGLRPATRPRESRAILAGGVLLGSAYAAFFGAGAGFIVLATLKLSYAGDLRALNAVSRLLICLANLVALPVLVALNPVDVGAASVMWPTTLVGGYMGARMSLRLPERALNAIVITLALIGAVYLLVDR